MTCDERIEKTLNRAGQTISDLPKFYSYMQMINLHVLLYDLKEQDGDHGALQAEHYLHYILHLTDIIDRMENALENVCGERDYLRYWMNQDWVKKGICERCPEGIDEYYKGYSCEWCDWLKDRVPEDWSVDDAET